MLKPRYIAVIIITIQVAILAIMLITHAHATPYPRPQMYFCPYGNATTAIVQELNAATTSIKLAMYNLNGYYLCNALVAAKRRGVIVEIIMDAAQYGKSKRAQYYNGTTELNIVLDSYERIFHSKYCVIDGYIILTGSMNWSDVAEDTNAENLYIFESSDTGTLLENNFAWHKAHSAPPAGKKKIQRETVLNLADPPGSQWTGPAVAGYTWSSLLEELMQPPHQEELTMEQHQDIISVTLMTSTPQVWPRSQPDPTEGL